MSAWRLAWITRLVIGAWRIASVTRLVTSPWRIAWVTRLVIGAWRIAWLAAVVFTALAACGRESQTVEQEAAHTVDVVRPAVVTVSDTVESFGSIVIRRKTDVTAEVDGVVASLPVEEGDRVSSGSHVAELENVQLDVRHRQAVSDIERAESSVELAEARLAKARENVLRELMSLELREIEQEIREFDLDHGSERIEHARQLKDVGGVTAEELRELEAEQVRMRGAYEAFLKETAIQSVALSDRAILDAGLSLPASREERIDVLQRLNTQIEAAEAAVSRSALESARAELDSVELLLEELTITAPAGGLIGARHVEVGERLREGEPVVSIFEEAPIHALLPVRESEAGRLSPGQYAEIVVPALDDIRLGGAVERVSPTVDPRSGSASVRVVLGNSDGKLRPGMFVHGSIVYGSDRRVPVVPLSSLVRRDGSRASIFLIRSERAYLSEVQVGMERPDQTIEVTDGLSGEELIIDTPSPLIREGDYVHE